MNPHPGSIGTVSWAFRSGLTPLMLALLTPCPSHAQLTCPPANVGQQSHGGSRYDEVARVIPALDGTILVGGSSNSTDQDRTSTVYGFLDFWVARLGSDGRLLEERSYGGTVQEYLRDMQLAGDGGLVLGGLSYSGVGGVKATPHFGLGHAADYWIVRTGPTGDILWERNYGGNYDDQLSTLLVLDGGGFLAGGASLSNADGNKQVDNLQQGTASSNDIWVLRLDANGDRVWEKAYGGGDDDVMRAAHQTSDGGYLLAGTSNSAQSETKQAVAYGYQDFWVVRIDADGNRLWDQSYGGDLWDVLTALVPLPDGGYLLAGNSSSGTSGSKTSELWGSGDMWVVRIDANGNQLWDRSYGGMDYDSLMAARAYGEGGFVLGGSSSSFPTGNKIAPWYGQSDYWVLRINQEGGLIWQATYGGPETDDVQDLAVLPHGGLLVAGNSYSPVRGNKTSPPLGSQDQWFVQLGPENPTDCDADGHPDFSDACPNTKPGAVVDADGCSIAQHCPCDRPWADHAAYVDCVRVRSGMFAAAGLITEEERTSLITQAEEDACPVIPQTVIKFGLTNVALGQALLVYGDQYEGRLGVTQLEPMGMDGVSVRLGEADAGVFLSPDAYIWGNYDDSWFMIGTAYGTLDGQPDTLLSTVRGTKPNYEHYPIEVDLSPLAPASITFQVYAGEEFLNETTIPGPAGRFVVDTAPWQGPRINPVWRQADGSVGVLVEMTEAAANGYPLLAGPFGDVYGDRVFIRADQPTHTVGHVSRVDVFGGGGFYEFSFLGEALGMFHKPHQALGHAIFEARGGQLTMHRAPSEGETQIGVVAELRQPRTFETDLKPLYFPAPGASFWVYGTGSSSTYTDVVSSLVFENQAGVVHLRSQLSVGRLEVKSYLNGLLTASHSLPNTSSAAGPIVPAGDAAVTPAMVSVGMQSGLSGANPAAEFLLDGPARWTLESGEVLEGDQFRIEGGDTLATDFGLTKLSLLTFGLPSFTITAEREDAPPPDLSISLHEGQARLTWPQRSSPYVLEAAETVTGFYQSVNKPRLVESGVVSTVVPTAEFPARFFRLRKNEE